MNWTAPLTLQPLHDNDGFVNKGSGYERIVSSCWNGERPISPVLDGNMTQLFHRWVLVLGHRTRLGVLATTQRLKNEDDTKSRRSSRIEPLNSILRNMIVAVPLSLNLD